MALRPPLVVGADGLWQQLQPGDSLSAPAPLKFSNQQFSPIVTNTTVETAWTFQASIVIPANSLTVGSAIRVRQAGVYQSGVSQSITPRVRLGTAATALTSRPILCQTPAPVSGLLNAAADTPWAADTTSIVFPDGSFSSSGLLFFSTGATAALSALVAQAATVSGVDRSVDNVLTASVQWAAAQTANQIRATTFTVEILKP